MKKSKHIIIHFLNYPMTTRLDKKNICAIYNVDVANENRKKGQKIKHVNVKRNQIPLRNFKKQHHHHQNKNNINLSKKEKIMKKQN